MQYNSAEFHACNPRNAGQLASRTFHHNAVLVKIHEAAHVGHVSHNTLLIYDHLHVKRIVEYNFIILHKRNLDVGAEPVRKISVGRIFPPPAGEQKVFHLFGGIPVASSHRHILNLYRQKQDCQQQYHCHGNTCPYMMFTTIISHTVPHLVKSFSPAIKPLPSAGTSSGCQESFPTQRIWAPKAAMSLHMSSYPRSI